MDTKIDSATFLVAVAHTTMVHAGGVPAFGANELDREADHAFQQVVSAISNMVSENHWMLNAEEHALKDAVIVVDEEALGKVRFMHLASFGSFMAVCGISAGLGKCILCDSDFTAATHTQIVMEIWNKVVSSMDEQDAS